MRLRVEIPLLASVLANALASETGSREAAERLSPLAQSIISMTLSSAGNPTVMRRDVSGHGQVDSQEKLAHVREQQPAELPSLSSVEGKVARKFRHKAQHSLSSGGDDEVEEDLSQTTYAPEAGEEMEVTVPQTTTTAAEEDTTRASSTTAATEEMAETTEAAAEGDDDAGDPSDTTTEESAETTTTEEEEPQSTTQPATTTARNTTTSTTRAGSNTTTKASTTSSTKTSTSTTKKTTTSTTTKSTTTNPNITKTTTKNNNTKSTTSKSTTTTTSRKTTTFKKTTTHRTTTSKKSTTHASTTSTTTRHVQVVQLPTAAPAASAVPVATTTSGPSFFYLQALEVAEAAARTAAAAGLPAVERAARAGEAAFDSAQSSALEDVECVKAAGAAAAAAGRAAGVAAEEQVRMAVLAAEAAAQKAGLLPDKEATAAAKAALAAAKLTGLPAEEQAMLAGRVVASVRESLQKALAVKIREMHKKNLAKASPSSAKMSDAEAVAAAVAAARSAMDAAQAADAAAREAAVTAASANGTLNASLSLGVPATAAVGTATVPGSAPAGAGAAAISPGGPVTAPSEDAHFNSIEAILRKLSETVASYSGRLDASNFRLEKVEDVERTLLKQLGAQAGGGEHKGQDGGSANKTSAPSASSEEKDKDVPFEASHPKIPPYMNTSGRSKYWMHGDYGAAHRVSQKPIHPHTQQDAVLSTEEVLALGPDEVAQVLTHDRKLLATVTARLSSGKELADLVFGTDSAELPQGQPTEQALKAILTDPELAKKAINLTMTTLSRGVSKLAAGKTFADEVFGSDTGLLIGEAFHPTEAPEEEVASAILPEKAPTTAAPGEEKAATTPAATGGKVPPAPAVPTKEGVKGQTTTEEAGVSTTAPEEGMKVFGVEMPSLPVEIPDLHVPNPFDIFR